MRRKQILITATADTAEEERLENTVNIIKQIYYSTTEDSKRLRLKRASETIEQRENRLKKNRDNKRLRYASLTSKEKAKRLQQNRDLKRQRYANLTPEARRLHLIQHKEAARIRRALETKEEKEIRSALSKKAAGENETLEERETRLFQEELLLSLKAEDLKIRQSLINESIQIHKSSTTSQTEEPNSSCKNVLYSDTESDYGDSLEDPEFKYDPSDVWRGWTETENYDESEQKKRPDETLEQWTERLSRITENEYNRKVENISDTGRACRDAATRAKLRTRKFNESESTKQLRRSKQPYERRMLNHQASISLKLKEKHLEINKERTKLRNENETPEEAAKRRLIDAERARLKEKIENSKAERIARLKLELETKKIVLANETPEERASRISKELVKKSSLQQLTLEKQEEIEVKRKQDCKRKKKAAEVETPELANTGRANTAANARQRIRMEKEELRIYKDFNSAAGPNDLEELLDDINTQNVIKYWYQYKSTKPHEQVIHWRLNNYSMMIKKQKNNETETPEQKTERATKSFEQMKNLICSIGEKVLGYLTSKTNYFNNYFKKRWTKLTEEQKNLQREKVNAYIRRSYHKRKFGIDIGPGNYVKKVPRKKYPRERKKNK